MITARWSLEKAFVDVAAVVGDDGRPLVETRGADPRSCSAWREQLDKIDEELIVWSRTFKRVYGSSAVVSGPTRDGDDAGSFEEADDDVEVRNGWDRPEDAMEGAD
ncbi:hypothetical protein AB7M74_010696 [Bradyrhizobium japonicum]